MLGPTNTRKLSAIFGELVRVLRDLPPGGFNKSYAPKPPGAAATKAVSFMCNKKAFKDAVRLAELGASLAEKATALPTASPDQFAETVLAGMKSLEAKVDQLALDTANLASKQHQPPKTFAEATASGTQPDQPKGNSKAGAKRKKPPSAPIPPRSPQLTLSQVSADKDDFVEISTEAGLLASRALIAIIEALQDHEGLTGTTAPQVKVRGITRNSFTGDIHLHLDNQESLKAVMALKTDSWVTVIHPAHTLRRRVYPIIIHGIPTTFDPSSQAHTHDFIEENHGVLDTMTRIVWANKFSIESNKPFSSLIVYLTDPAAANQAITNRVCFRHMLKVTEKSTKRIKQCYNCLDFGHYAKSCTLGHQTCSHCAGAHHYRDCTKLSSPIRCANCTHHTLDTEFPDNSQANIYNLNAAQKAACSHSAFSNTCHLRRLQVAKNSHMSDLYDIPSHV